jgi:hypothetical protein
MTMNSTKALLLALLFHRWATANAALLDVAVNVGND